MVRRVGGVLVRRVYGVRGWYGLGVGGDASCKQQVFNFQILFCDIRFRIATESTVNWVSHC